MLDVELQSSIINMIINATLLWLTPPSSLQHDGILSLLNIPTSEFTDELALFFFALQPL